MIILLCPVQRYRTPAVASAAAATTTTIGLRSQPSWRADVFCSVLRCRALVRVNVLIAGLCATSL
jgi:hypothetical protein